MTSGSDPNVGLLQTDVDSRERIPGSPLVPGGVAWSEDGRLAVVSDSSVLIATFRSRQLEMFQPQGPAVSKDFVFLPERTAGERLPIEIPSFSHPLDSGLPRGSASYFLLNESDRHQHNPKEMSLSKNAGAAFVGAVWGPRGSAPNSSCALLALTASSRISLHFPPSFHMSWKETAVFSDKLFDFFQSKNFRLSPAHDNHLSQSVKVTVTSVDEKGPKKKRKGLSSDEEQVARNSIAEYAHKCAMMSTLSVAWSPFMLTSDKQDTISLIAFSGRKVSTVWVYPYPSFVSDIPGQQQSLLSQVPVAWIDTEQYGRASGWP
ncbi:hypothetical protein PHYBOEH_009469 [Phytophthora boehmeriae]|uniref:Transcription factor IIIC 90kDa subunit N-terminal domain-containing protein n=1 Tax=Phytophthora boehmeriae TaxID=109152 RepID=A0A8T1XDY1_9STRA|nr:hypothetical protein PHYBOEH_009469 [Phytophthora boehmeriae]